MSLVEILGDWLDFRQTTVRRRLQHRLNRRGGGSLEAYALGLHREDELGEVVELQVGQGTAKQELPRALEEGRSALEGRVPAGRVIVEE